MGSEFIKMAGRLLWKRKMRTGLTIVAIILGVGILTGVNVTADSIQVGINNQISQQLGNNDIIVRTNKSIDGGWFNYSSVAQRISAVDGVSETVPRIIKNHPTAAKLNQSGISTTIVALDPYNSAESSFGKSNITQSIYSEFVNTSQIESLFIKANANNVDFPIIISQNYASQYSLKIGDSIYLPAENSAPFNKVFDLTNSSTWLTATIIGIIIDTSEAVHDFMPEAKVWELRPPSTAVYIDINIAWNSIFNGHAGKVNMIFVHVSDQSLTDQIRDKIESLDLKDEMPSGVFTQNVKALFTEGILQVNFLMRGIFSIFSAISLLVCAIIIKNLLEMAKEEQTHEIGVMRAIGVTKGKIFQLYITQILIVSTIGSVIGIFFGYFISGFFVNSYVDAASAVGTDFSKYSLQPVLTPTTIMIGLSSGILVSLIFGYFPARAAANVDPLEALRSHSEKPKKSLLVRAVKHTTGFSASLAMLIGGGILVVSAFSGLFLLDIIIPEVIIMLFLGVIFLILGLVFLVAFFFPVIVPTLSYIFYPLLREMRKITSRNLGRYSRQTKNTFAMLAIGLSMMITVGMIMNSAYEGAYPGGKTITGGDLQIGDIGRGHVQMNPYTEGLRELPNVAQVVPIRFSLGFQGITRIDRIGTNDTFGGTHKTLLGTVDESFHLGIFDPIDYYKLHNHDSIVRLSGESDSSLESFSTMMKKLETPYTIILQNRLARSLGRIKEGEKVQLRFEGFEANFTVIGIFEILPVFYWSYYATESAYNKQFAGAISWKTYSQLVDDNIGKADLIIKNKVDPIPGYENTLDNEKIWGYASTPLDVQSLETLLNSTNQVQQFSRRSQSPFWGLPPFEWHPSKVNEIPTINNTSTSETFSTSTSSETSETSSLTNSSSTNDLNEDYINDPSIWYQEVGAVSNDWNQLLSRAVIIDPKTDSSFGNTTLTQIYYPAREVGISSIENLFLWAENNLPNTPVCVLPEIYVNYNLSTGEANYIKQFQPGNTIRIRLNSTFYQDILIIGTTNSHYPYEFQDEDGNYISDTGVLNFKTMSFNTYTANTTDWSYYFEVLDLDPNSIFLSTYSLNLLDDFIAVFSPDMLLETFQEYFPESTNIIVNSTGIYFENSTYSDSNTTTNDSTIDNTSNLDNQTNVYSIPINTTIAWLASNLAPWYGLNTTENGILNDSIITGSFTYDGQTYVFNGTDLILSNQEIPLNFSLDLGAQSDWFSNLISGNLSLSPDNITTSLIVDLNDSLTLEDLKDYIVAIEDLANTIPTLRNTTFFSPKLFMLEDSGMFDVYFLIGAVSKDKVDTVLLEIQNYYEINDLPWNKAWIKRSTDMEESVGGILGLIVNMFFGVLSFALITALVGLAISTIIAVKKRYAEIGTLRTLGFSNKQIIRMVVGEGIITAVLGIVVGVIGGLLVGGLIINSLPFMIFLPMVFAPPYKLIFEGMLGLLAASMLVSFVPAISATKIDIAEAIRTKGE